MILDKSSYRSEIEEILNDHTKFSMQRNQLYNKPWEKDYLWSQDTKNEEIIAKAIIIIKTFDQLGLDQAFNVVRKSAKGGQECIPTFRPIPY